MEVMFEVISRQKFSLGAAAQHVFGEVGGYVGRGEECEWVLPDKSRQISRKHALISFDQTHFSLEDISSNGIFDPLGRERLHKNQRYKIEHGATYIIGDYTIQARLLHKPDACLVADMDPADAFIPDDMALDPDPLVALEQEDVLSARKRLGMYSDLLGVTARRQAVQPDHATAPQAAMPSVTALPEDWNEAGRNKAAEAVLPPEPDGAGEPVAPPPAFSAPDLSDVSATSARAGESRAAAPSPAPAAEHSEMEAFFRALGYEAAPASAEDRERVLARAAHVLLAFTDGMLQALRNRADGKNELRLPVTTMTLAGNNPLKFSPTARAALDYLLAPPVEGMLPPARAVLEGFNDLHRHHLGLVAGARAAVRAVLERVGPDAVEAGLDASGPVRLRREARLWAAYRRAYHRLHDDHDGFAAFFLEDFARAYEMQVRTVLLADKHVQGEKS